jgi:hypothetical protein
MKVEQIRNGIALRAAAVSAAAEEIGALILGVEGMIADQRHLMAEANAPKLARESELWAGMEILLEIVKRTADQMEADGTAIQNQVMAA